MRKPGPRSSGKIRPETLLVLILTLLSAGIVSASVAVALDGLARGPIDGPIAVLPDILFSPEPTRPAKIAPVTAEIQSELETPSPTPPPSPSNIESSPSAQPSSKPTSKPTTSPTPQPSPSTTQKVAFSVAMRATRKGNGQNRTITYETTVTNAGDVALSSIHLTSHVPAKTTWADSSCGGRGLAVFVQYEGSAEELVCTAGTPPVAGSDDPSSHPVDITLGRTVGIGSSVVVRYLVDVDPNASGDVTNHAHVQAHGVLVETGPVVTRLS